MKSISLSTDPVSSGAPRCPSPATALTETFRPQGPWGSLLDTEVNKVVPSCQTKALKQQQNNKPTGNASLRSDSTGDRKDVVWAPEEDTVFRAGAPDTELRYAEKYWQLMNLSYMKIKASLVLVVLHSLVLYCDFWT